MKAKAFLSALILVCTLGVFTIGGTAMAAEQEQQSQFAAPIMVANTSFLNVRTGPGIQFTVLVTVVGGTEMPVLGVAPDRVWYQVSTVAGVGWLNSEFAIPRGDFTNVPLVDMTTAELVAEGLLLEQNATIAVGPGAGSASNEGRGITFGGAREFGISITEAHPARTRPTQNATSPGTISPNENIIYSLIEAVNAEGISWYRINTQEFGLVWIESVRTQFRPYACAGGGFSAVRLVTNIAPIVGPDGSGTLDGELTVPAGTEAYLLDAQNNRYKIELIDGNTGWIPAETAAVREPGAIPSEFCTSGRSSVVINESGEAVVAPNEGLPSRPRLATPRVVINTGFLNVRSGPGAQYSIVSTVPGGTELSVVGFAPDGVWYLVQGSFGQGWVNSEFTLFRGDGSTVPIIENFVGASISNPTAVVGNAVTLYAAPNETLGVIGALSGPSEFDIVARTEDFAWVQVQTSLGFGWVVADLVTLTGDLSLIPVVN